MPIFEYRCGNCGQTSEFLILGRQESLRCRHCGSDDLVKLMSAHNISGAPATQAIEKASGSCCGSSASCDTPGSCCSR